MVGWAPVPNACPGSTTTGIRPSSGSSQGGPTQSRPIRTGLVEPLPGLAPPGLHIGRGPRPEHLPETLFAAGLRVGGELDSAVERDLLEPFGEELDQ